jgi:hypothetical protein
MGFMIQRGLARNTTVCWTRSRLPSTWWTPEIPGRNPGYPGAEVKSVLVYRGLPSSKHNPKAYARSLAQQARWERDRRVQVHLRPLQYRPRYDSQGSPVRDQDGNEIIEEVREKGVDVLCALAVVREAASPANDLVILASHDTDLEPALDEALRQGNAKIETCQWFRGDGRIHAKQLKATVLPSGTHASVKGSSGGAGISASTRRQP